MLTISGAPPPGKASTLRGCVHGHPIEHARPYGDFGLPCTDTESLLAAGDELFERYGNLGRFE